MTDESPDAGVRLQRDLQNVLRANWSEPSLSVTFLTPFGSGHSGFTYRADVEAHWFHGSAVLRTSPPGVRIAGPADVERQARIIAAVGRAGVPVPRVLATSSGARLDGRSFMLTELVDGSSWELGRLPEGHRGVASAAVDVLKVLHKIPVAKTGIGNEIPIDPTGEVERWARLLERAPARMERDGTALREVLLTDAPTGSLGLVHGDYHYGNLLYRDGRVVAVLDWEIAELGDPRMDLASLAVSSLRRKFAPVPNTMGSVEVVLDDLYAMYGMTEDEVRWFVAASCYKYAAIFAYNLMLHRTGRRPDVHYELLVDTMGGLLREGLGIARTS